MTEVEKLVLEVESKGLTETNAKLDTFTAKAEKAEGATQELQTATGRLDRAEKELARAVDKSGDKLRQHTATTATNAATTRTATTATLAASTASKAAALGMGILTAATTAATVALAALVVPILALSALTNATRKFQDFQAQLKTATGSIENANKAYGALASFAATTPYSLDDATAAFIKLVNYGLNPGERALRSYGNTASAMGKTLMEFIEAVSDAATGENERLKEFGIKASKHGDSVTYTFRGMSETIKNEAGAIEEYLTKLGENNFATAMSDRAATLGGAISNLGDAWDTFLVNLSKQGADAVITQAFRAAVAALDELNAVLASGQFQAELDSWLAIVRTWSEVTSALFAGFVDVVKATAASAFLPYKLALEALGIDVSSATAAWLETIKNWLGDSKRALALFPSEVTRIVKLATIEFVALVEGGRNAAKRTVDVISIELQTLVAKAAIIGKAIASNLTPFGTAYDPSGALNAIDIARSAAVSATTGAQQASDETTTRALDVMRSKVNADADGAIKKYEFLEEHAATLRELYDDIGKDAETSGGGGDTLAGFGVQRQAPTATSKASGGGAGGASKADAAEKLKREQYEKELDLLIESLTREDEVLAASFETRKRTVLDNASLTESEKTGLILSALESSLMSEEEALRVSYEERRAMILAATKTTEEEKNKLIERLTYDHEQEVQRAKKDAEDKEGERRDMTLKDVTNFFGDLSAVAGLFGKKGFKASQALAIAETTMQTASAAMKAYNSLADIKYVGPVLGAAAAGAAIAYGAARIAQIRSAKYSGEYEHGGMIPGGSYGIVGEAGPELVRGPALVTSARTTAAQGTDGGRASPVVVNVINQPGQTAEVSERTDADGARQVDIVIKKVEERMTANARTGGGTFVPALQQAYGLSRARG